MASTSQTTPDTPVTLKVNYDGTTRRTKLPLRDLGASSLEDKVRHILCYLSQSRWYYYCIEMFNGHLYSIQHVDLT